MGLGLPLVRQIVDQHGGEISVDTALGEGTTITITVPMGEVPALRSEAEN